MCSVDLNGINKELINHKVCKKSVDTGALVALFTKCDYSMDVNVCDGQDSELRCAVCKNGNINKISLRYDMQCSEYCVKNNQYCEMSETQ